MRVGIRELKQRTSGVIRRVVSGESVEVTDRGQPVARIVPMAAGNEYERMVAGGEIVVEASEELIRERRAAAERE